ncbi:condensin complex protein MksE [Neptuniibacter halophilus]|uniref:condensin complex protein MksE n=1 Tax=Neptuniibacter halophilus TaxID=651666 RepID=UPI0025747335|nr:hypothetical protein [Neptuniibacter halophilus]
MNIDLKALPNASDIIDRMTRNGYHISRSDNVLFTELDQFQDQYKAIFALLGYELNHDPHGFIYLSGKESGNLNKSTREMALTVWTLVELLTNKGYEAISYITQSPITRELIREQFDSNKMLLEQGGIGNEETLMDKYHRLKRSGFCDTDGVQFYFRAPVQRFLQAAVNLQNEQEKKSDKDMEVDHV